MSEMRRFLERAVRRVLFLYWRFARGMTFGVRGIVVNASGEIFLVKHGYVAGWHLPGGGVEVGETTKEALVRELAEEGNITLAGPAVLHGLFYNPIDFRRDHIAVFIVREFRQESAPRPGVEIIAHGFFAPDALPADTTRGTRARIAELRGAPISERW